MADRTLRIKVSVDENGRARRNVQRLGTEIKGVKPAATGAGVAIGGMVSRALGAVAVADVFRRIATTAIGMNRQIEDAELRFQALGLSTEEAERHVANLFTFAQRTPFETAPIIEASAQLANFGGAALNSTDNLRALGNAAAGSQSPIERVAHWAGRMFSTLESGKEAIGESTAALLEMGAISGETRIELEKMAASGASAQEVFDALVASTEQFGPALENAQSSVGGLTSSIADNFGQLLGKLADITGAFSLFKAGLEVTNAQYSNFNETLTGAVDVFGLAKDALTGNIDAWADLKLAVTGTTRKFNDARRDAGRLDDRIESLTRAVGGPSGLEFQTTSAADALAAFADEEERITEDTKKLRERTDELAEAQKRAEEETERFRESVTNLGTVADQQIRSISMWEVRTEQLTERYEGLRQIIDHTTATVRLQTRAIEGLDDAMTTRIQPTLENQKGIMESFKDDALGSFGEFFGEVKDNWGALFSAEGLGAITTSGLGVVQNILATALGPLGPLISIFTQFGGAILGFFGDLFGSIGRMFGSLFRSIADGIGSLLGLGGVQPVQGRFGVPVTGPTPTPGVPGQGPSDEGGTAFASMAAGGFGTVTRPTLFLAGEAGPEQFAFSGANRQFAGGMGGSITINFHGFSGSYRDAQRVTNMVERTLNRQLGNRRVIAGVV
jgi:hypothetical protein